MIYQDMENVPGVDLPEGCLLVAQVKVTEFIDADGKQQISMDTSRPIDTLTIVGMLEMSKHYALVRNDQRQGEG